MYERSQLESYTKGELETIAASHGLEIEGTGSGGNILKKDLMDALLATFQSGLPEPQFAPKEEVSEEKILASKGNSPPRYEVLSRVSWIHIKDGNYDREFRGHGPFEVSFAEWEILKKKQGPETKAIEADDVKQLKVEVTNRMSPIFELLREI